MLVTCCLLWMNLKRLILGTFTKGMAKRGSCTNCSSLGQVSRRRATRSRSTQGLFLQARRIDKTWSQIHKCFTNNLVDGGLWVPAECSGLYTAALRTDIHKNHQRRSGTWTWIPWWDTSLYCTRIAFQPSAASAVICSFLCTLVGSQLDQAWRRP